MKDHGRERALHYQRMFPPGTRVLLLHMNEEPRPIPDHTKGTVMHVDDIGQLHCRFDSGLSHTLVPGVDRFCKLTQADEGGAG